jgi:predicted membrane GTPase involved in stress response
MARYRRTRRYRRRSGRWAANIQEFNGTLSATPGTFSQAETILTNPAQSPTLVTQVFTVKNVEVTFNLDFEGSSTSAVNDIEAVTAYIMYVPQGMTLTNSYNIEHPEYIMTYKYLGSPTIDNNGQQYQPYKIRTRLARKLQSGDNVILFIKGTNQNNSNNYPLRLSGLVRWWTKAN